MSDNMPDFDKMSPEEITTWLETLAKRQGATEGLTTSADMDIAEIDPSTVVIDEPGYVPYGQEKTQPVEVKVNAPPPPPKPALPPEPIAPPTRQANEVRTPPPQQQPTRQAPPAPQQPTRQAPPPPQNAAPPARTSTPPPQQQPTRQAPPAPQQPVRQANEVRTPPLQQPIRQAPPQNVTPPATSSQERTPPRQIPTPPATPVSQPRQAAPPQQSAPPPAPADEPALAWLESLAADQGEELFNLDLSEIGSASGTPQANETRTPAAETPTNPMTWLEDLARSQVAEPSLEQLGSIDEDEEESEKLDPFADGVNPMEWLETLAKRQGAKDEELTTGASLNVPQARAAEVEQNDYQPFSFDTPPTRRSSEPAALEDPADFLNSLAGEQGYSESGVLATQPDDSVPDSMSMTAIEDALSSGTVTREQMQKFLDQTTGQMAETPEEADEGDLDLDMPLAPAEIPDWLSDLMPSAPSPAAPQPTKPIDALFEAPPTVEVPDWLRQDVMGGANSDIDSIFDAEESEPISPLYVEPVAQASSIEIEVDPNDPWVEAFDQEYEQGGSADVDAVPEWYEQNVHDPERIAAVEGQTEYQEDVSLEEAALPAENGLTAGQPQAMPEWVTGFEQAEAEEMPAPGSVFEEMPDWLKEVESSVSPQDVPDWLVETISSQDVIEPQYDEPVQEVYIAPEPVIQQAPPPPARPVQLPPKPVQPPPQPTQPRVAVTGPASEVIERARDREQSGDLEGALAEYESMIRTNVGLDAVVDELSLLVKSYKTTPAVYRVLGDGLMRQGKLQAALNTYREALNQI